jgi:serine/threonine protein kinase
VNLIGTHIGSYVVEGELGAGCAGTVYACRHTMIDREAAVKVLHDEHVNDPDQVARFFQEAKAAADIGQSRSARRVRRAGRGSAARGVRRSCSCRSTRWSAVVLCARAR